LDDELIDHQKIHIAGRIIGKNGRVIAIGFYAMALMWSNKHLSDGILSVDVIDGFRSHALDPLAVADALAKAGLFDRHENGFRIHDFRDVNPSAAEVKRKRREDRERKRANGRVDT